MRNHVKHSIRKFVVIILSLLLCASNLPISAFAGNETLKENLYEAGEAENMSGKGITLNLDDISGEGITQNLANLSGGGTTLVIDDKEKGEGLHQFNYSSGWNYADSDYCFNRSNHYSSQNGAYVTLRFIGTQIRVYSPKGGANGDAAYSIDNGAETIASLYNASGDVYSSLVYESPQLVRGEHTLKIRRTGTGIGAHINVDRVEILGADEFDKGELIWSDEFDGTELDRNKWDPWFVDYDGSFQFPGDNDIDNHMTSPDFYSVENGVIKIGNGKYAEGNTKMIGNRTVLGGTTCLITKYTHLQTYGYIEVSFRKKTDKPADGLAVWTMPGDGFIGSKHGGTGSEVDLIENDFGGDRERSQSNTIWNGYSDGYT